MLPTYRFIRVVKLCMLFAAIFAVALNRRADVSVSGEWAKRTGMQGGSGGSVGDAMKTTPAKRVSTLPIPVYKRCERKTMRNQRQGVI